MIRLLGGGGAGEATGRKEDNRKKGGQQEERRTTWRKEDNRMNDFHCDIRDLYVCLSVRVWKPRFPEDWRFLVEECFANIGIFGFLTLLWYYDFKKTIGLVGSFQTRLLCIVWELAGGVVAVAMAVGVSDRWQVALNMWHVKPDIWHLALFFFPFLFVSVRFGIGATTRAHCEIQCQWQCTQL